MNSRILEYFYPIQAMWFSYLLLSILGTFLGILIFALNLFPDLLVLDEPLNGLDNEGVEEMRHLFLTLKKQGKTILLASHSREDIEILCDKVYELDKGRVVTCR